jgi:hypothetical protein
MSDNKTMINQLFWAANSDVFILVVYSTKGNLLHVEINEERVR